MTEEEAKTKWCPYARFKFASTSDQSSSNREPDEDGKQNLWLFKGTRCIGSACMVWRWEAVSPRYEGTSIVLQFPMPMPTDGHCGLAGKP